MVSMFCVQKEISEKGARRFDIFANQIGHSSATFDPADRSGRAVLLSSNTVLPYEKRL